MRKSKKYTETRFAPEVIREAVAIFEAVAKAEEMRDEALRKSTNKYVPSRGRSTILRVDLGSESWQHDNESEFFADYRRGCQSAHYMQDFGDRKVELSKFYRNVTVEVEAPSRQEVEEVFAIFEKALPASKRSPIPEPEHVAPPARVFIGHGGSPQWRELKDHLTDKHDVDVIAYESGARAGMGIRDILAEMLTVSSFAVLIMTGEDEAANGQRRARQNVVHETGLFQGKLGFNRAIVLLEEGTEVFSNLQGTEQLRYPAGRIAMVFGDVVAAIRREFPFEK